MGGGLKWFILLTNRPLESTPASFFQPDLPTSSESNTIEPKLAAPRLTSFDNEPENLPPTSQNSSSSQLEGIAESIGDGCIAPEAEHMEVDLNQSRRKRRRTTSPNVNIGQHSQNKLESTSPPEHSNQQPQPHCGSPGKDDTLEPISHEQHTTASQSHSTQYQAQKESLIPISITNAQDQKRSTKRNTLDSVESGSLNAVSHQDKSTPGRDETAESVSRTKKPKKILHFNVKTGTIGSPPAKRSAKANAGPQTQATASRGRKKRKSLVITLKYGQDAMRRLSIGDKIDQIFANTKPECTLQSQKVEVKKPPAKAETAKSTHPFFLGKSAPKPPASTNNDSPSLPAVSGPTKPVSPKTVLPSAKATSRSIITSSVPSSKSNDYATFGSSGKLMKFPGAAEPIWPPSGMTHIRGLANDLPSIPSKESKIIPSEERKSKYTACETTANEDILKIISAQLEVNAIHEGLKEVNINLYEAPDRCLRVPRRHFESGYKLQRRVRSQIQSALNSRNLADDSSEDDLSKSSLRSLPHPAVIQLYQNIPTSLSAFDKSQYQTQSWIHKYSPHSAAEVLQSGREAFILKEWLQSLTVLAVDTGMGDSAQTRATAGAPKSEKEKGGKRKRKAKNLDGFIVSSDEEADDMDEVSDSENFSPLGSLGMPKKTVVRRGDAMSKGSKEPRKLLNTVVISGPNGCGKTAAVYAVAKELGFEVFEINSSSRRSGKDILEKVGDMTKNHLVQQTQQQKPEHDDDLQRISDALDADLESGRQGTMKSFFKSSGPETKLPGTKKSPPPAELIPKSTATASKKPKQQKQSLILLEEVDILFEEDKQFWTTVLTLIAQSKRPIIMTCNDESVVLNQPLPLHAVIRFTPPPVELAVDYMLLVAANEGHVLQRQAVTTLYQAQRFDLRASMTELEFWCQMGVGDRRGGFDWFCPRLPPGIDKDSHGNTIRVVSEGTYKTGMGWLGRDSLCDPSGINDIEEEILREAWDGWQLDAGDWHETLKLSSWAGKMADIPDNERLAALEAYDEFADALSVADLCACGAFNTGNDVRLPTSIHGSEY